MDSNLCKTREDIYIYLVSNLEYVSEKVTVGNYRQVLGFRQKMWISQVWYNETDKRWGFHVSDHNEIIFNCNPNMGEYNSFPELLEGVTNQYALRWGIR